MKYFYNPNHLAFNAILTVNPFLQKDGFFNFIIKCSLIKSNIMGKYREIILKRG